jgi:hypothetical protein
MAAGPVVGTGAGLAIGSFDSPHATSGSGSSSDSTFSFR